MATVPTVNEIKQHLYLEHDDDDTLIAAYLDAAKEILEQQTGADLDTYENAMATQFLKLQVSLWYEQRLPVSKESLNAVPHSLDALLRLIKLNVGSNSYYTSSGDCSC